MNEHTPMTWTKDGITVGLSGLFPGPVIDGGRRFWDWNPNSRYFSMQRWYAGLDSKDWAILGNLEPLRETLWDAFRPPFCSCNGGGKCPGPSRGKCFLCRLAIEDCAIGCNEDVGHVRVCVHWKRMPSRYELRREASLARKAPKGKDRNRTVRARFGR